MARRLRSEGPRYSPRNDEYSALPTVLFETAGVKSGRKLRDLELHARSFIAWLVASLAIGLAAAIPRPR